MGAVTTAVAILLGLAGPAAADSALGSAMSLSAESAAVAAIGGDTLGTGASLGMGDELRSASGEYRLVLQTDGNLVIYGPQGALWASSSRGTRLVMQSDGNLVLYSATGAAWYSRTTGSGVTAVLGNDGSLRVVSSAGATLWRSAADPAKIVRDRLRTGESMVGGERLTGTQNAVLVMQPDGNLVRYETGSATWSSGTRGSNPRLVLQTDGNLVLYVDGAAAWSTRTAGRGGSQFVLQGDGNAVLYAGSVAIWNAGLSPDARVITLVNAERAKAGCPALRVDSRLARAATDHSRDMAANGFFDHVSPRGSTPTSRAAAAGYPGAAGENIAAGYASPDAVVQAWMASSGHRANILNCNYVATGVGSATGGYYGIYWTQNFGLV